MTFHRAIDLTKFYKRSIKTCIKLGIDRILTSGRKKTAFEGMDEIREIVQKFGDQIEIMAGSGICTENLQEILAETSVTAVHFSASSNHCKVTEFGALRCALSFSSC